MIYIIHPWDTHVTVQPSLKHTSNLLIIGSKSFEFEDERGTNEFKHNYNKRPTHERSQSTERCLKVQEGDNRNGVLSAHEPESAILDSRHL